METDRKDASHSHSMVHDHRDISGGTARAAVFGVSDGLVSNAALILGVAAAKVDNSGVLIAGIAGLLAGASSMAAGEYISVKAENELIEREINIEKESLENNPTKETKELQGLYMQRGLNQQEAAIVAEAVHRDPAVALEVHTREELGVDPNSIGDPIGVAVSSFIAFAIGAIIPILPWFFVGGKLGQLLSLIFAGAAAAGVGAALAKFTERSVTKTALRQLAVAALACGLTYAIGSILGVQA